MGRGRMELIKKEKNRMITFQKRKEGLMKKAYELSTLCGIDVCVIIYAPHFDDQGSQFETWPKDTKEVYRIIEKYNNTTIDRIPKIYDVQEYYKDRIKKVEGEIAKVQREKLKIMYPTWDDSFNAMGEEQLRMFATMLDNKLDVCNQRINVLKQDQKGRVITEELPLIKGEMVIPNLASNSSSYHNFLTNIYEGQVYPIPHMKPVSDNNNHVPFYPFNLGQNSQSSMLHFQTPNSQSLHYEAPFQLNGLYNTNALQPQMFNYMHGWNNRP
ncbi:hypothetical protein Lal_00004771 [Lupinus albus]|uniref:Putative transcription factor MADS-type1 family n=1 Tax=Lupinus albus TaxID=3870 RepID=A0A6A4N233_LUPAL|nr:putative transcription factor MADS-type1 family [Lupinus albus]KAF1865397.1 hypothetical protein Lal_00004771 [Lupinus albus]